MVVVCGRLVIWPGGGVIKPPVDPAHLAVVSAAGPAPCQQGVSLLDDLLGVAFCGAGGGSFVVLQDHVNKDVLGYFEKSQKK